MRTFSLELPPAIFSGDRKYRYTLSRCWNERAPRIAFVCLNPSTADETNDDPTIRRCIGFAKKWGYGSLVIVNLFAFRSTDPKGLYKDEDPIGSVCNDYWIQLVTNDADLAVACWGTHGKFMDRGKTVKRLLGECKVFGFTKQGFPKHPLYLSSKAKLRSWK